MTLVSKKEEKATMCEITIRVQYDNDCEVRGNACCSGDDAFDKQVEDAILARLESGDVWAWALIEVEASFGGLTKSAWLGACCYEDEKQFLEGNYLPDLVSEAVSLLQGALEHLQSPIKLKEPEDCSKLFVSYAS